MPILQLPRVRCFGAFPGEGGRERRTLAHPRANTDSLPSLGGQLSDRLVLALPPTQPHALRPYLPPHRVHGRAWSPEGQGTAKQCLPHQLAGEEDGRGGNIPQRGDGYSKTALPSWKPSTLTPSLALALLRGALWAEPGAPSMPPPWLPRCSPPATFPP